MNNSKMWLTVNPNLGVPLLLGSVAVASLVVHGAVLTTTPWIANYYQGLGAVAGRGRAGRRGCRTG